MANLENPVKAIRAYCLDCTAGQTKEVELCPIERCPLYPFRFGKNPYRATRVLSEEQKAKQVETLRQYSRKMKEGT